MYGGETSTAAGKETARHSDRIIISFSKGFSNKCLSNKINVGTRTEVMLKENSIGKYQKIFIPV